MTDKQDTDAMVKRLLALANCEANELANALTEAATMLDALQSAVKALVAERDQLRATVYTDNSATIANMQAEIERLEVECGVQRGMARLYQGERDALQAKLDDAGRQEPVPPFGSKRKAAMAVYKPPFAYKHGYIYDSQQLMVSDHGPIGEDEPGVSGAVAARVRGWGKLGYLPNGAELQDEIGQMMADALNALYTHPAPQTAAPQPLEYNTWTHNDGDTWSENPADAEIIYDLLGDNPKVGDKFQLRASVESVQQTYRITSVSPDGECEVELVEAAHGIGAKP